MWFFVHIPLYFFMGYAYNVNSEITLKEGISLNYSVIMEEIKSTRDFKDTKVKAGVLEKIAIMGRNAVPDQGMEVLILEDGGKVRASMEGKAGYFGKFIEAPHYMAVVGDSSRKSKENAAYMVEMLRFVAHEEGLGSCWITVPDNQEVKSLLNIPSDKNLCALVAVGQIYAGMFKKDIQQKSSRQAATEIAFLDRWGNTPTWEELSDRGFATIFYLTRFAPSWGNRQPWKFLITPERIYACSEKEAGEDIDLDFGIVKFYFEKACVDQGLRIEEIRESESQSKDIPEDYEVRAVYSA